MNKTAIAIAAAIAFTGPAAVAQPVVETASVSVSFADLDLTRVEGRATLERRLNAAISRLCPRPNGPSLEAIARYEGCRRTAWSSVDPQLAALYSRTFYAGQPPIAVAAK